MPSLKIFGAWISTRLFLSNPRPRLEIVTSNWISIESAFTRLQRKIYIYIYIYISCCLWKLGHVYFPPCVYNAKSLNWHPRTIRLESRYVFIHSTTATPTPPHPTHTTPTLHPHTHTTHPPHPRNLGCHCYYLAVVHFIRFPSLKKITRHKKQSYFFHAWWYMYDVALIYLGGWSHLLYLIPDRIGLDTPVTSNICHSYCSDFSCTISCTISSW